MQRNGNMIGIGIAPEEGYRGPQYAEGEVEAVKTVMGGVETGVGQLVTAARKSCPNPNCCLNAEVTQDEAEGGSWSEHPMNDTTYTVDFTRVQVGSKRLIECVERADRLTDGVVSMVEQSVGAIGKANTAGRKKTSAATEKAKSAMGTAAVARAQETIKTAEAKAKAIRSDGAKEAKKARNSVYTQTKKEIVASVK